MATTLSRIRALAIPPAWTDVWICPRDDGHLQATGRDARGRKQYRYHARWREVRDETKYGRLIAFGRALPRIRRRVARDLRAAGPAARQGARRGGAAARDDAHPHRQRGIRARERIVRPDHAARPARRRSTAPTLRFSFRGKSGVRARDRRSPTLASRRSCGACQDLPGEELFQYVDEDGERAAIESADVNAYLREIAGEDFTGKDFRTWAGTLLCRPRAARPCAPALRDGGTREIRSAVEAAPASFAIPRPCAASATSIPGLRELPRRPAAGHDAGPLRGNGTHRTPRATRAPPRRPRRRGAPAAGTPVAARGRAWSAHPAFAASSFSSRPPPRR